MTDFTSALFLLDRFKRWVGCSNVYYSEGRWKFTQTFLFWTTNVWLNPCAVLAVDHFCYSQWLNSAGTGWNGVPQPVSGVPLPQTAVPSPKVVVPPPGDAVLFFGQLIFGKIITIVVTRDQILRLKCTKFYFGWGSAPDPAGGAYSAPPDP